MTAVLQAGRGSKELRQGWERKPEPAEGRDGASRGWGTARMGKDKAEQTCEQPAECIEAQIQS